MKTFKLCAMLECHNTKRITGIADFLQGVDILKYDTFIWGLFQAKDVSFGHRSCEAVRDNK